ncbi:MAG: pseudouridine synthase [Lachnospiraceae bacterium]|nr:pseudouridine synthase [Lachnospiraceae bacterium]
MALLGEKVDADDVIKVNGEVVTNDDRKIYIAYNKPKGIICTESNVEKNKKISDVIKSWGLGKRLFTIGRLDKDTTGLILITNDGSLAKEITNTHKEYEKEYEVRVNKAIDDKFVEKIQKGVYLSEIDKTTKPCKIKRYKGEGSDYRFNIIIKQGLNRQVRRMCKELGYHVTSLKRVRVINYKLGDLKIGEYKEITKKDIF